MLLADGNGPVVETITPIGATGFAETQTATSTPYVYDGLLPKQGSDWNWTWIWIVLALGIVAVGLWVYTRCCWKK